MKHCLVNFQLFQACGNRDMSGNSFFFFFSDSFQQNYVSGIELDENPLQIHIMFGSAVIFLQLFKKDYRELFLIPQKQTKIFQRDYSQSF